MTYTQFLDWLAVAYHHTHPTWLQPVLEVTTWILGLCVVRWIL